VTTLQSEERRDTAKTLAEKLLGWPTGAAHMRNQQPFLSVEGAGWIFCAFAVKWRQFEPHTRIEDAWLLVESLLARGIRVVIHTLPHDGGRVALGNWGCDNFAAETAPTVTEAICAAAMRAIREGKIGA